MRYLLICLSLLFLLHPGDSRAISFNLGGFGKKQPSQQPGQQKGIDLKSLMEVGKAVSKSFEDISPAQEYYIGRSVGAVIVNRYKPYDNQAANDYLNLLGQALAQASDMPETFNGYHFLILDSDEINAFAAPSGLIFVTRGLIRCCNCEAALAAVLAHEIGHVELKHGLQSIKKSRVTTAVTTLTMTGAGQMRDNDMAKLLNAFGGSITDITKTMVNNGYSRSFEYGADKAAVTILQRVGYNPSGLIAMLRVMKTRLQSGGLDFAKTHPSPDDRIAEVGKIIEETPVSLPQAQENRYQQFSESL